MRFIPCDPSKFVLAFYCSRAPIKRRSEMLSKHGPVSLISALP